MRKAIIFGVNGYLGRHLAAFLAESGTQVSGYDLQESCELAEVDYSPVDVLAKANWERIDLNCDELYYLAGVTGTDRSFEQYEDFLAVNELSLLHLLNALRRFSRPPRVVFPSSRLVYAGGPGSLGEDAPKDHKSVYAVNKLAGEMFLAAYGNAFGIPWTTVRICVPYGNRFGAGYSYGTVGFFTRQARERGRIVLYGDGKMRRTFTHIDDAASQMCALARHPQAAGQVFNLDGEADSLLDLARGIADHYRAKIEFTPFPPMALKLESGDTVFDASRIRVLLGENPVKHCLREEMTR